VSEIGNLQLSNHVISPRTFAQIISKPLHWISGSDMQDTFIHAYC